MMKYPTTSLREKMNEMHTHDVTATKGLPRYRLNLERVRMNKPRADGSKYNHADIESKNQRERKQRNSGDEPEEPEEPSIPS